MLYQLKNGKTIRLSEKAFFEMSDEDLQDLEASEGGSEIDNVFFDSALEDGGVEVSLNDFELPEDLVELPEDLEDLTEDFLPSDDL